MSLNLRSVPELLVELQLGIECFVKLSTAELWLSPLLVSPFVRVFAVFKVVLVL